jgi:hypothetical protein
VSHNVLCIKISTPETISTSSFILIHAYFWKMVIYEMAKPLTYLMKLVNIDTTWQMTAQGRENEVLYNLLEFCWITTLWRNKLFILYH